MKKLNNIIAVSTLVLLLSGVAGAQTVSQKSFYSIDKIQRHNQWLFTDNAAGLVFNKAQNFSVIGAYYNNEKGDYRNYNDPGNYNILGIETKSFVKVKNVYYYGQMGYEYGVRLNQAWLGTIIPNSNFNTINDSIPGKVLRESYTLKAKVGYNLTDAISIGVGFDYLTATSAKRVDGRNENTMSSHEITPGVLFDFGVIKFGVNGIYRKTSEKVEFSFIGDVTGKNLYYFEGGMFINTTSGITSTTISDRMYQSNYYGGAVQLQLGKGKLSLLNSLSAVYRSEDDYEDDNLIKRYAFVDGLKYNYKGILSLKGDKMHQYLDINFINDELYSYSVINNYEPVPGETSSWAFYEYGKVLRYKQIVKRFGVEYQNFLKRGDFDYSWIFTAGYKSFEIDKQYKVYPAAYSQNVSNNEIYGIITKSFATGELSRFDLNIGAGVVNADGVNPAPVNPLTTGALKMNERVYKTDFAFSTSDLFKMSLGAKFQQGYGNKGRSVTAALKFTNAKVTNAPDLGFDYSDFTDKSRNYFEFSIGYNF